MKKYILDRTIRSFLAVLVVVSIAIVMLFTMIPREKVFDQDQTLKKISGDNRTIYKYNKWQDLGYLDFDQMSVMCKLESDNYNSCLKTGSEENLRVLSVYESKGYKIDYLKDGTPFAFKNYTAIELIVNFYTKFIKIDHPWVVNDADNENLERKYYVGTDFNGLPAIMCSGCEFQYQVYFNSTFPFIHTNLLKLNFGNSYPTNQGIPTMDVISTGQGKAVTVETTFPTGVTAKSALNLHTCRYKVTSTLDHLDLNKFDTNYANCASNYDSPSMISTSYLFGIVSIILAYLIALPAGMLMARKKGHWQDKIGIAYINFLIAVPSLAFIYFVKLLGQSFGMPDKFPQYGFQDYRSYILPMLILALLQTASLMTWIRRYMVDQTNADYVKFARAKGLSQKEIFNKHILKNAIIPIVNGIPASIILCISGSVITESVFAIPGMGKMLPDAIKSYNNNMVITLTFIFTALAIFSLLFGDILMTLIDPRIQLSAKGDTK